MIAPVVRALVLMSALSSADLQRLEKYDGAWAGSDNTQALTEQARGEFAGRGVDLANHFLVHTGPRPRNDVYFFVLRAVGDAETAVVLIRAMPHPPAHESGVLDRHFGEIAAAIEAVLENDRTRGDPRIVSALEQAIAAARGKPYGTGAHEALESVRLLGKCRSPEAAQALKRLAADPDAAVRTAAASALGQLGSTSARPEAAPVSPAQELLRILSSDPDPAARRQAAESLGSVDAPDTGQGLRAVLNGERDPLVVDAILQSLRRLGIPVDDPAVCRDLIGRTWEAHVAEQMVDCWIRGGVTRDTLVEAALAGPATLRAAALYALVSQPRRTPQARSLVLGRETEPIRVDPALRNRLMDAAVSLLSHRQDMSSTSRDRVELALWELSDRSMRLALTYADRVTPNDARFHASDALARADATAYDAARRSQQAAVALMIAVGIGWVAFWRRWRRPALLMAAAAAGWAAWIFQATGARDLPPPPLQFLTVAALSFLSAGVATGAAALMPSRSSRGRAWTVIRVLLTVMTAGVLGAVVCAVTRNARLFPARMDGWELIFDPLAATILTGFVAAGLVLMDRLLPIERSA